MLAAIARTSSSSNGGTHRRVFASRRYAFNSSWVIPRLRSAPPNRARPSFLFPSYNLPMPMAVGGFEFDEDIRSRNNHSGVGRTSASGFAQRYRRPDGWIEGGAIT